MQKLGIDISEHNGNVRMDRIKATGVEFVMIRASWGHFQEDAQVRNNVNKCKLAGMPFGFYHYSYADTDEAARVEATEFLRLCRELGGYTYPLNLDMEDADGWKANNGVSDTQNIRTIQIFKDIIEGAGEYLTLYMSKSWFDNLRNVNAAVVDSIDPWLAHWGIDSPSMDCGMWQYSSDGNIDGSSSRTDVNFAYKDYPAILASLKGQDVPSIPQEEPSAPVIPEEPSTSISVVKIKQTATNYSTGEEIPDWVKNELYTVLETGDGKVLLTEIMSWVNISDIEAADTSSSSIEVGCSVMVKNGASDYNGNGLASFVYNTIYDVIELNGDRVVIGVGDSVTAAMHISNVFKV